jgi:beta-galactosidase
VTHSESLRDGHAEAGDGFALTRWFDHVATDLSPEDWLVDGRGIVFAHGKVRYVATWPDADLLDRLVVRLAGEAGIAHELLPIGVRIRRAGDVTFAFNHGAEPAKVAIPVDARILIGSAQLAPAGVAVWQCKAGLPRGFRG